MDNNIQVPHIKASAIIDLQLSTAFLNDLQIVYLYLLEGHDKSEADVIRDKLLNKSSLTSWEASLVSMTTLISTIHKNAEASGQVEYKSLEQSINSIIS